MCYLVLNSNTCYYIAHVLLPSDISHRLYLRWEVRQINGLLWRSSKTRLVWRHWPFIRHSTCVTSWATRPRLEQCDVMGNSSAIRPVWRCNSSGTRPVWRHGQLVRDSTSLTSLAKRPGETRSVWRHWPRIWEGLDQCDVMGSSSGRDSISVTSWAARPWLDQCDVKTRPDSTSVTSWATRPVLNQCVTPLATCRQWDE
jgi:hypothetical protein